MQKISIKLSHLFSYLIDYINFYNFVTYTELDIILNPYSENYADILIAFLGEIDFDSFINTPVGIKAYINTDLFHIEPIKEIFNKIENCKINFTINNIKQQNWNKIWESNYKPIVINNECIIKAPFHKNLPKYKYEIIITPKMSFGTGHHETTYLMLEKILKLDLKDKNILDIGSGTGILAILASLKGAKNVLAIDNDEICYKNSLENIEKNNLTNISVLLGDSGLITKNKFQIILANISKNVHLENMKIYSESLETDGILLISGLYLENLELLKNEAVKYSLDFIDFSERNNWIVIMFSKT